ncbi:MAG TPA: hypothetical protein VF808_05245 [Ktedonobacterales bacterium]
MAARFHRHILRITLNALIALALVTGVASGAIARHDNSAHTPSPARLLKAGAHTISGAAGIVDLAALPIARVSAMRASLRPWARHTRLTAAEQAAYDQWAISHPSALPAARALPLPKPGANFVGGGAIPSLASKSAGINSTQSGGWYPPDQAIAAAPGYIFVGVNNLLEVDNTSYGVKFGPWTPDQVFASVKHSGDFFSDPQITFDAERAVYLIAWLEFNPTTNHDYIDLAISKTSSPSPLGNFYVYQVAGSVTGSDDGCDYPTLGYDYWGAYITCLTYSVSTNNLTGNRLFAFSLSAMLSGALGGINYWYNIPSSTNCQTSCAPSFALSPTIEDGVPQAEWIVSTDAGYSISSNLILCALTNTQAIGKTSPPTMSCDINTLGTGYSNPIGARQPGTTNTVDPGLGPKQIAYRNGRLVYTLVSAVNCNGVAEDSVTWIDTVPELTTIAANNPQLVNGINGNATESGYICFGGTTDAYMPAIIPSGEADIALVFNLSSAVSTIYPSIAYTGRMAVDAPYTMGQGGKTAYVVQGINSTGSSRWGDYSACALTTNLVSRGVVYCGGEFGGPNTSSTSSYGWDTELYSLRME